VDELSARLLAAADGDGWARSWWRTYVLTEAARRDVPLHIGVLVTDLLADGDLDDSWVTTLTHRSSVRQLPAPGELCAVKTRTDMDELYGQVLATHLQPARLEADGSLPDDLSRRRVLVDVADGMRGFELDDTERAKLARIRDKEVWLDRDGHLQLELAVADERDDATRYAQWLADDSRRRLRRGLPDRAETLRRLLHDLVEAAGSYEASVARVGAYLCGREQVEAWLDGPIGQGRLRDEFARLADELTRLYPQLDTPLSSARRAAAALLDEQLDRLDPVDRARLTVGPPRLRTLFALCETVQQRLPMLGPPLLEVDGRHVLVTPDDKFGIAGVWDVQELTADRAETLRDEARAELDAAFAAAQRRDVQARRVPFQVAVSRPSLARQALVLPTNVLEQVPDGAPVRVRLSCAGTGRYAHQQVVVTSEAVPDAGGSVPMAWPALMTPNTVLDGLVSDRGRRIELTVRATG
jgi:hypothetical protein